MSSQKHPVEKTYGKKGFLLPFSVLLSALGNLIGMMPFICVWLIVRLLLTTNIAISGSQIIAYAWLAFGFSILFIIFYFLALMLSHLAAFRLERNLRYSAMQKIVYMPLGFFTKNTTGKMRKIIDDNASIVHMFVAHQLPDLAGGIMVFLATLVLMFIFDWRLGVACLVPLVVAFAQFYMMMGKNYVSTMQQYMTSLEAIKGVPT